MKTKRWLAYADDKGVYEPDEALLKRIVDSEEPKSADSADPFSPSQKKSDQSAEQDVAPTGTIISISFQHPFICASWHTSNVRQKINSFYEEACDKSYRVVDCRPLREAIRFRPKPVLEQLPPHWSQRLAEGVPKGRRDGDVRRKDWR